MAKRGRKKKRKLIIIDDHTLVRDSLVRLINEERDLQVVDSSSSGEDLLASIEKNEPDLILLDIELPEQNGLALGRQILAAYPKQKLIFLTMHRHEEYALRGLRAGAAGYMLKTVEVEELLSGIRKVLDGDTYITQEISDRIARYVARNGSSQAYTNLSEREFQVLRGLATGKSCRELSDEFELSVKTIYTYRKRLLDKLNLENDIDLLRYVLRHNLLAGENEPLLIYNDTNQK
jgi:DNA-binding NarL/FixJ family response regulator